MRRGGLPVVVVQPGSRSRMATAAIRPVNRPPYGFAPAATETIQLDSPLEVRHPTQEREREQSLPEPIAVASRAGEPLRDAHFVVASGSALALRRPTYSPIGRQVPGDGGSRLDRLVELLHVPKGPEPCAFDPRDDGIKGIPNREVRLCQGLAHEVASVAVELEQPGPGREPAIVPVTVDELGLLLYRAVA